MNRRSLGRVVLAIVTLGTCTALFAAPVPEIDPATGANAIVLLAGAVMVIRSRRK